MLTLEEYNMRLGKLPSSRDSQGALEEIWRRPLLQSSLADIRKYWPDVDAAKTRMTYLNDPNISFRQQGCAIVLLVYHIGEGEIEYGVITSQCLVAVVPSGCTEAQLDPSELIGRCLTETASKTNH